MNTNLHKLYDTVLNIYKLRKDSHPEAAALYHVEHFMLQHKNDKYFNDLILMEIEDCNRAINDLTKGDNNANM